MKMLAVLLVSLSALLSPARAAGDGIHVRTLDNGLRVVVREDHSKPLAALRIYVRTGGAFEMEFLGCGISHYYEHLLSGGTTGTRSEAESARILQRLGGQSNAYTAADHTCYHIVTHRDFLATAIDLYGDWITNNVLEPAEVEREKGVILKEINMGEDEPARVMGKLFLSTMFKEHPIRVPNIGYRDNFARLTRDDLVRYYRNRYSPDNAVVAVAGDVSPDEVFALVEKAMGKWERRPLPVLSLREEPRQTEARYAERELDVKEAWVRMGWHTVDMFHEDLYDLDMISAVLSEGRSSRLFQRVVEKEGLADTIDTWSWTPWYMPGSFGVSFQVPLDRLDRTIEVVKEEVRRIASEPVSVEELERAKTRAVCRYHESMEKVEDQASQVGLDLLTTDDARFSDRYLERVLAYTPERMRDVAKRYLRDDGLTVVVLKPKGSGTKGPEAGVTAGGGGEIVKKTLENGLTLLVRRIPGVGPVAVETYVHGGLRAEPAGKCGVSNLMARLLLKGTAKRSPADIVNAMEAVGGSISTQSGNHTVGVSISLPRGRGDLPVAADLLADVLKNAAFPAEEFEKVKRLATMQASRLDEEWETEAFFFLRREAYGDAPYGRPTVGTPETVMSLTRDDVVSFAKRWIDPKGMVVSVAGDVDVAATLDLLATALGGLESAGGYAPPAPPPPSFAGGSFPEDRFVFKENRKDQAVLTLTFAGPAYADCADRAALLVIDAFTSGIDLPSGWFHEALRGGGESLVYYVHFSVFAGMEGGIGYVMTQTQPDLLGKVHGLLMAQVDRLRAGAYSDEDLEVGRAMALVAGPYGRQKVSDIAQESALGELYGLGYDFDRKFEEAVKAVTREDVKRVVDRYFGHAIVGVTGSSAARAAFEALQASK